MIMSHIKISGMDQYLHENLTWDRALDFYLQENAFLKTRLSQVLDKNTDKNLVALAEQFQNRFIHNDEYMKDLQTDIVMLQRLLKNFIARPKPDENKIVQKHKKLRNEMGSFEKNFAKLIKEFNQFLTAIL